MAWAMLAALAAIAGVALYTYLAYRRAASELVIERDRQLAILSGARLREELTNFTDILEEAARDPGLIRGRIAQQRQALAGMSSRLAVFDGGVILLDNFGRVRGAVPGQPAITGQNRSDRDYFYQLLSSSNPFFSDAITDGPDGAWVVVLSVPVRGEQNEFSGVLAGMFRLGESTVSAFYANIVRLRIAQTGSTYIVDGNGRIIYSSDASRVGQMLPAQDSPAGKLSGESGAMRARDETENDVLLAHAPIPGTNWRLVIEDDWQLLTSTTSSYANLFLVTFGVGLVIPAVGVVMLVGRQNAHLNEQDDLEFEERIQRAIQKALLPVNLPVLPGWEVRGFHSPGRDGGRDFFDCSILPDGRLLLTVGQVEALGLAGGLQMASVRANLRGAAQHGMTPAEALSRCGSVICAEIRGGGGMSCVMAILDPVSGRLQASRAGDLPALVSSANGTRDLGSGGGLLGESVLARYEDTALVIESEGRAVISSRGLVESTNRQGEPFGTERFRSAVERAPAGAQALLQAIREEWSAFHGGYEPAQDVTLLVIERGRS